MRKEPIIAIILGSLLGLGVAFGVWRFTQSAELNKTKKLENQQEQVQTKQEANTGLSILEPLDNQVFKKSEVTISGLTSSNTLLAIHSGGEYKITKSNPDGTFESEIELSGGLNDIEVWAFENEVKHVSIPVVHSTEIEDGEYVAVSGTVTDIAEVTVQVKTMTDQIEQISVTDNTTYASIVSDPEQIEFAEIAIGDYVVTIGAVNDNSVLETSRVLVAPSPEESASRAIRGTIVELSNSEFLVDVGDEQFSIDATGGVDVTAFNEEGELVETRLTNASEGEEIIIVGYLDEELQAEVIHIFPQE